MKRARGRVLAHPETIRHQKADAYSAASVCRQLCRVSPTSPQRTAITAAAITGPGNVVVVRRSLNAKRQAYVIRYGAPQNRA